MSRLAQNWIETNFSLPRPISTLEKSFSNGYLFIKILEQKRIIQTEEVNEVIDGETPGVILKNMNILSRGLKLMNIHLSKQQIADVNYLSCPLSLSLSIYLSIFSQVF